jgi:Mrp family chromosome partitioning ATPase/capsular polysaccharide biosynthesis protein
MEPIEDLRALGRRWWVLVTAGLVGILGALVLMPSPHRKPTAVAVNQFRATHTIELTASGTSRAQHILSSAQLLLQTGEVQRRLVATLGPQALVGVAISSTPDVAAGTLGITATSADAASAVKVADTAAIQMINAVDDQLVQARQADVKRLNDDIAKLTTQIDNLGTKIVREDAGDPTKNASTVDRALQGALVNRLSGDFSELIAAQDPSPIYQDVTPAIAVPFTTATSNSSPASSRAVRVLLGLLLAVGLAAAAVIVIDRFDTRIRTRAAAESALGLPVLAEVPALSAEQRRPERLPVFDDPGSIVAEGYRALRTALRLAPPGAKADWNGRGPGVVLLASPGPSEGRSSVTANLAASFAETSRWVLAVDADGRHPQLPVQLGVHRSGAASMGQDGEGVTPGPSTPVPTRVPGVFLLPGEGLEVSQPGGLPRLREIVRASAPTADMVLIDTPPLLLFHDANELLPAADVVVLVCRVGHTTVDAATRAIEQLTRLGGTVVGVCLVGVPQSRAGRLALWRHARSRSRTSGPDATVATTPGQPGGPTGEGPVILERWRRDDRVLWRNAIDGVLLFPPGATEPVAVSEPAGRLWQVLGSLNGGGREAGQVGDQAAGLSALELERALAELVELGAVVHS